MECSYKFRIYPNKEQIDLIQHTFGCCRFVYNHYLDWCKKFYEKYNETLHYGDCSIDLPMLKLEYEWLTEVDSTALQSSLKNLDAAYENFFCGTNAGNSCRYPKYKKKRDNYQSYTSRNNGNIILTDSAIKLPKLGFISCRVSKKVVGKILYATISKKPSGKYYVSVNCSDVDHVSLPLTGNMTGVDLGINNFATLSNGQEYLGHRFYHNAKKRLSKLRRRMSRKSKDSKRREKARIAYAKLHEHIAAQRMDALHKLSTQLVREYDVICLEDLHVKNLMKNPLLYEYIYDAGWREFRRQITYKATWYGKVVSVVDKTYPSSQLCSSCGFRNFVLRNLSVRKWTCPSCGEVHNRDVNAAKNILLEGIRLLS